MRGEGHIPLSLRTSPGHPRYRTQNYTGLALPGTREAESALRNVNMAKVRVAASWAVLVKLLKDVGMPVQVGIDVGAHRLNLSFKAGDSIESLLQQFSKLVIVFHI